MKIVNLQEDISFLEVFVSNLSSKKFRYFDSRPLDIVSQHLYSCLFVEGITPFAYGHLDLEDDKVWLGIAIINMFQKKGFGLKMMNHLFYKAKERDVSSIYLAVDCDNTAAINLYKKLDFMIVKDNAPKNYIMRKFNI